MIASTKRGVLITRFWYIRGLNPRTISYTGLTRDGTFLIENGKISRPVTNFRFNQSLVSLLQNVEALGKPRTCRRWGKQFGRHSHRHTRYQDQRGSTSLASATRFRVLR